MNIPRPLLSDAYTIGSAKFESNNALRSSSYYLSFRKSLNSHPLWFRDIDDSRILVAGIQRVINEFIIRPITINEINDTEEFLQNRKISLTGLKNFDFNKQMWLRIIKEFDGIIPICIEGVPEGSVVYPKEPVIRVYSKYNGFGQLCAWFEGILLNYIWSASERLTWARHWLEYNKDLIRGVNPTLSEIDVNKLASTMCHDFGFRAATCLEESLNVSYQHLYCFGGTDTFAAAYNAYINGASSYDGISVDALAHRVVQGFVCEEDSYRKIYDSAENGDIISMVADCYNYKNAVEKYLLPLAKESIEKNNGKIVVCRPDSGDPLEDILWTIDLAEKNGLFEITRGFKYLTTLRLIHGDSMTFEKMITINNKLISMGWAPHGVLIYGVGGFLRNIINRDNLSAKYALYKVGNRNTVKFSNTPGKYTLPDVKVLRDPDSLSSGITIVDPDHYGVDSLVKYYSYGNRGKGLEDGFLQIKNRILNDFNIMPKHGGILDSKVQETIENIKKEYVSNG